MVRVTKPTAIIPCVEYHDRLAVTLPHNLKHFGRTLVVTDPCDVFTAEVCARYQVPILTTDVFFRNAAFNRGAAINEAIRELRDAIGWLLVLDADILIDHPIEEELQPGFLYGARRRCVELNGLRQDSVPMADTVPYGYFQLFHATDPVPQAKGYPTNWSHAGGSDETFAGYWEPERRKFLGQVVRHIGRTGIDWAGRVSAFQDGTRPALAETRRSTLEAMRTRKISPYLEEGTE